MEGVWVVYAYDTTAYPIMCFSGEMEARRFHGELGYGHVGFWKFKTDWQTGIQMEHVYEDPDDPYKTIIRWEDGELKVIVEAQFLNLPELSQDEIKAECDRRVQFVKDRFEELLRNQTGGNNGY